MSNANFDTKKLPPSISDRDATRLAYDEQIQEAQSFLKLKLSVLVVCDKLVVGNLLDEICMLAELQPRILRLPQSNNTQQQGSLSLRQRQLAYLRDLIAELNEENVLVIPHLDLLAGGTTNDLTSESREVIELVYDATKCCVLAFSDRSLDLPEVLQARFAARLDMSGLPHRVKYRQGDEADLGEALITRSEGDRIQNYHPDGLYKNVAGMNPIRLRHAIKYAVRNYDSGNKIPVEQFYRLLQAFKAQRSEGFELPTVGFDQIGGFKSVKDELERAIHLLLAGVTTLDPKLQKELIPRGFVFHGPPGTGKTLFAKAIAHRINATIQVVSGPEVTNMYVGESERRVRELFNEARKNAPAVLVFEEFDSIAAPRTGRDDGGSRAGNALVAQILTEMDGFRPEVPILVIGTTNQLNLVDPALLRPSRFKPIRIGLPDQEARRSIAEIHSKHFQVDVPTELLDLVAEKTLGFNGDEIRSLFRDACVGKHLQNKTPDAKRLGELVGAMRRQQSEIAVSSTTGANRPEQQSTSDTRADSRESSDGQQLNENTD